MKKVFKILGVLLVLGILFLIAAPFLFKGTFEKLLKENIEKNINAEVSWTDFDLSLFSSFPDAALTVSDFSVVNRVPFEGDTLASGKLLKLDMGITQVFKSGANPIKIDGLILEEALVNIKVDSLGNANYDISKEGSGTASEETKNEEEGSFSFDLERYELINSRINYLDEVSKTFLILKDVNHEGKGDFSASKSELDTQTEALVSLKIDETEYLSENSITLDALFQLDLENQTYTFLENEAKINELPLTFDGFIKLNEDNSVLDISFKTPSSDFKNFLAVIPKEYVKNLDGVTTTGNFSVEGELKGTVDDTYIPKMDIRVRSENASFKYAELPKEVKNITINADLKNTTGLMADTYLNIGGLTFKIDDEVFNASGSIKNLTKNAIINLALKGTIDLANIERVLPIELDQDLIGVFKADVTTSFDMASIENEQYQNIKTNGTASLSGFQYTDEAFNNPIEISNAAISMGHGNIQLQNLDAKSGQTDLHGTGTIQNLIPWIMAKQDLKGRFDVSSKVFNMNDFMSVEETEGNSKDGGGKVSIEEESIKIPDFLDATINFNAQKVIYDDLILKNAKGTVGIKDETADLRNVTSNIFGGDIALSGNVNTQNETPTFAMDLDLNKIDIDESFGSLALLKYIAPIAQALEGSMNTKIKLNGQLNDDLTPNLSSLAGNALAQVLTAEVNPERTPLLSKLGEQAPFLKLDKLSMRDVTTALSFDNGNIVVQPFTFDVQGVKVTAGGSHGLDKSINYNLTMDVPAKYLGSEVTSLLAKLDPSEANSMRVALPVAITGNFTSPKISVDSKSAVNSLTKKLIENQKQDLKDKGTDILKDLIGGGKTKPKDSSGTNAGSGNTPVETTTEVVKDLFGDLFGKKKKKKKNDSTKTGN